jgi:hypothetical protein
MPRSISELATTFDGSSTQTSHTSENRNHAKSADLKLGRDSGNDQANRKLEGELEVGGSLRENVETTMMSESPIMTEPGGLDSVHHYCSPRRQTSIANGGIYVIRLAERVLKPMKELLVRRKTWSSVLMGNCIDYLLSRLEEAMKTIKNQTMNGDLIALMSYYPHRSNWTSATRVEQAVEEWKWGEISDVDFRQNRLGRSTTSSHRRNLC